MRGKCRVVLKWMWRCRNPAEERKRTRARVGSAAVEPQRPLRNLQPWATRAMDGAAAALQSTARSEQCAPGQAACLSPSVRLDCPVRARAELGAIVSCLIGSALLVA